MARVGSEMCKATSSHNEAGVKAPNLSYKQKNSRKGLTLVSHKRNALNLEIFHDD